MTLPSYSIANVKFEQHY